MITIFALQKTPIKDKYSVIIFNFDFLDQT